MTSTRRTNLNPYWRGSTSNGSGAPRTGQIDTESPDLYVSTSFHSSSHWKNVLAMPFRHDDILYNLEESRLRLWKKVYKGTWPNWNTIWDAVHHSDYFEGLAQNCSNSIANALELLQSCTKPSIYTSTQNKSLGGPQGRNVITMLREYLRKSR